MTFPEGEEMQKDTLEMSVVLVDGAGWHEVARHTEPVDSKEAEENLRQTVADLR
jgi:hypothetical protein